MSGPLSRAGPSVDAWASGDLPQALQDKGGWQSRDTAKAFADYAGFVAEKLSDRVHHFFTINEFRSFVDTDSYLRDAGKDAPRFTDEDLKIISSPLDFVGINVYKPTADVMPSNGGRSWRDVPFAKGHPKMSSSWHTVGPEAMYWAPRFVHSLWKAKEIFITENGCATQDVLADDGMVYDTDRIMFVRSYLTELQRATADGVPVKGYFQWSRRARR